MDWTGKKIRILFNDAGKVLSKIGWVKSADNNFVEIETQRGIEILPVSNIVRMEVINGN